MSLNQIKVLIAEDEPIIGFDLAETIGGVGYEVIGPSLTTEEALFALERSSPHMAVIDPILRDGPCLQLLDHLRKSSVVFLIYSGNRRDPEFLGYECAPWLEKPATPDALLTSLTLLAASIEPRAGRNVDRE